MIIERIINNNVVSSKNENGKEIVIMGNGIGFGKKRGECLEECKIEKIFHIEDEEALRTFKDLLKKLPLEYIQVSNEIISYAKKMLGVRLNENVYITLTDHISFALQRFHEGMLFPNALHNEIKRFYTQEYRIGMHALQLIKEKTNVVLPDDEAASIALHLLNAEFDIKVSDSWKMTDMIGKMIQPIIEEYPQLQEDSFEKDWILSELKFMAYRIVALKPLKEDADEALEKWASLSSERAHNTVKKVSHLLEKEYGSTITQEESVYLTIFLYRIENLYKK